MANLYKQKTLQDIFYSFSINLEGTWPVLYTWYENG